MFVDFSSCGWQNELVWDLLCNFRPCALRVGHLICQLKRSAITLASKGKHHLIAASSQVGCWTRGHVGVALLGNVSFTYLWNDRSWQAWLLVVSSSRLNFHLLMLYDLILRRALVLLLLLCYTLKWHLNLLGLDYLALSYHLLLIVSPCWAHDLLFLVDLTKSERLRSWTYCPLRIEVFDVILLLSIIHRWKTLWLRLWSSPEVISLRT